MSEFLARTFYGSTFGQWLAALLIIGASILVGRTLYWLFRNFFRRVVDKSKNRLDNIILDMIEEPVVLAATIFGVWLGLNRLTLPDDVTVWIGNGMQGVIILSVAWLVSRLIDSLINAYLVPFAETSENDLDDQLLPIVRRGLKVIIWTLGIVVALNNAGYNVAAIIAGLGIGGLALAMAAKDTVSNVFGGFTIFTDRPFRLGDRIRFAGFDGTVKEIGLRSTRLRTLAGTLVTIPNAKFADSPVENVSAEPSRKVTLELGLTYDTTPERMEAAIETLKAITESNPDVEETVYIGFSGFGDFSMNLYCTYYIKSGRSIGGTQTAINLEVLRRFSDQQLEFAFPTQTILHKSMEAGTGAEAASHAA